MYEFVFWGYWSNLFGIIWASYSGKGWIGIIDRRKYKKIAQGEEQEQTVEYGDIEYESVCIDFQFANNRSEIECYRSVEAKILAEELCDVKKSIVWTGSSYDGTELVPEESDEDIRIEQTTDFYHIPIQ